MEFFLVPAVLLLIQSILSLAGGFRFLRLIRKAQSRTCGTYQPTAALIIPCKGVDEKLRRNAEYFLTQDYGRYQIFFVVASERDPAYDILVKTIDSLEPNPKSKALIVTAGYSDKNGEKVNNLLAGVAAANPDTEVLAFADIDAQPARDWLRFLVAPLESGEITVSTGYRWYLPSATFASRLRAAWDTSIATMMGEHDYNFVWGGSMAIRLADFKRLRIAKEYWQGTVSDDYAVTRAVRNAGGKIHFEPRCFLASQQDSNVADFLEWTNRQIIITRVYAQRYWRLGLASHGLYVLTMLWGLALLIVRGIPAPWKITAAVLLASIVVLGMLKGATRTVAARILFPSEHATIERYGSCYWRLAPLTPWIMLYNFVVAGFRRRIEWCGTVYELRSRSELRVVARNQKSEVRNQK
jgi:ceramide glucosyltransferase